MLSSAIFYTGFFKYITIIIQNFTKKLQCIETININYSRNEVKRNEKNNEIRRDFVSWPELLNID